MSDEFDDYTDEEMDEILDQDGAVTDDEISLMMYGSKADVGGWHVVYVAPLTRGDRRRNEMIDKIAWTLEHRPDVWTPAQKQAVLLFYVRNKTMTEAARFLGISFHAFRDRLVSAERHALRAVFIARGGLPPEELRLLPTPTRYTRRRRKRGARSHVTRTSATEAYKPAYTRRRGMDFRAEGRGARSPARDRQGHDTVHRRDRVAPGQSACPYVCCPSGSEEVDRRLRGNSNRTAGTRDRR